MFLLYRLYLGIYYKYISVVLFWEFVLVIIFACQEIFLQKHCTATGSPHFLSDIWKKLQEWRNSSVQAVEFCLFRTLRSVLVCVCTETWIWYAGMISRKREHISCETLCQRIQNKYINPVLFMCKHVCTYHGRIFSMPLYLSHTPFVNMCIPSLSQLHLLCPRSEFTSSSTKHFLCCWTFYYSRSNFLLIYPNNFVVYYGAGFSFHFDDLHLTLTFVPIFILPCMLQFRFYSA